MFETKAGRGGVRVVVQSVGKATEAGQSRIKLFGFDFQLPQLRFMTKRISRAVNSLCPINCMSFSIELTSFGSLSLSLDWLALFQCLVELDVSPLRKLRFSFGCDNRNLIQSQRCLRRRHRDRADSSFRRKSLRTKSQCWGEHLNTSRSSLSAAR